MAIHPIDLSTVYSQIDNIAKFNASQNQMAQVANQQGINKAARDNLEKSQAVKETPKENGNAATVKQDGRQGASSQGGLLSGKKDGDGDEHEEENVPVQVEISDPRLGRHIDITG
ncbi:MAG: hypothetical protein II114_01115 [Treponema sp.]|nr:hypothetical protein [Treponema sp.]MBQ4237210.1 hypothetical protein [Treponema sp.]MBQ5384655.1 hypothetical protein [Treponema sp.]